MGSNEKDIVRGCQKFQENYKYYSDTEKEAIIYLKLRKEGCPRKSALNFSSKTVCRSDSTRTIFGPPNYRLLRVVKLPNYTIQKGWFQGNLTYKMDKDYYLSYKDIIHEDSQDDNLQNIFDKNEDLAKQEFKKMLDIMKQYFEDISAQFQLNRGSSNSDYLKNIKNLIEETRLKLKYKTYFEYKNVKFYYLSQLLKQILESEKQNPSEIEGVIEKFNIFNEVLKQPDIKNIEIKQEDYSNDDSFLQISPHSKSAKKNGYKSGKKAKNSNSKILNNSLNDSGILSTPKPNPKVGSLNGSESGYMHDLTQEGSLSKQSSFGALGYMSDSINSFGYQQSGEDKTISPESDSPNSSQNVEHLPKKQDQSIIHSAAMQLQLLQQMDQTNQDLFSVTKGNKSQMVTPLHGSTQSKRILEQQFNEAQYFYQSEQQKKKKEDEEKKKKQKEKNMKSSLNKAQQVFSADGEEVPKKKKIIKIQNLLKVDSDVEEVFESLVKTTANTKENREEYQKVYEQYHIQVLQNQDGSACPTSPNLLKSSLFRRDFIESSKSPVEKHSVNKNGKKIVMSSSAANFFETQKKQDKPENPQYSVFNKQNITNLVDSRNQMMENFRKRNYKSVNSFSFSKPYFSFHKHPTPLTIKIQSSANQNGNNSMNSHLRNKTYSYRSDTTNPLRVQVTNTTLSQTKQSKISSSRTQYDNKNDREEINNQMMSTQKLLIKEKLLRLTTSMAKGNDLAKKKMNLDSHTKSEEHFLSKTQQNTPLQSSRLSQHTQQQIFQAKSILKNLSSPKQLYKNHYIQFS